MCIRDRLRPLLLLLLGLLRLLLLLLLGLLRLLLLLLLGLLRTLLLLLLLRRCTFVLPALRPVGLALLLCLLTALLIALSVVACVNGHYHSDKQKNRGRTGYSHEFHGNLLLSWSSIRTWIAKPASRPRLLIAYLSAQTPN